MHARDNDHSGPSVFTDCNLCRQGDSSPAVSLVIVDVEKVKGLSNYYVSVYVVTASLLTVIHCDKFINPPPHTHTQLYIIQVTCKNGNLYTIRRRYRQFDDLHNCLEKRFPIEAGAIRSKDRTLPTLPGVYVCVCVGGGLLCVCVCYTVVMTSLTLYREGNIWA